MRSRRIDPIAHQLQRLDEHLESKPPLLWSILIYCPAAVPAAGFIVGMSLRQNLSVPWYLPIIAALLIMPSCFLFSAIQSSYRRSLAASLMLAMIFACLGILRLDYFYRPYHNDVRFLLRDQPYPASIGGVIVSDIYRENRKNWVFAGTQFSKPKQSFYLRVEEYQARSGNWEKTRGMVRVQVGEPKYGLCTGDRVRMFCILDGFDGPSNPGQFDFRKSMRYRGVYVAAAVQTADGIRIVERPGGVSFRKVKLWLKKLAWTAMLDEIPDQSDQRTAMATALLLGYQKTIDLPTNEAFVKTGLSHVISLSGMHMAIIAAMVWTLAKLSGLNKRKRALMTFAVISLYAMVVPPQPPTLRAVVIFWFFCAAVLLGRNPHPINTLAVTAVILLLCKPTDLFRADWQLSYGTILGILLFYKPLKNLLSRLALEPLTGKQAPDYLYSAVQVLVEIFAVGFAAWAGGSGILLWHFGCIVPMCPVWTAIVSPIVPVILYLGFFKMLLAGLLPTVSALLGWAVIQCSDIFALAVRFFARIDVTSIRLGSVPGWIPFAVYLLTFLWFCRDRLRLLWVRITAAGLIAVIVFGLINNSNRRADGLVLQCLSIGHGQAIVLTAPDGTSYLFDGGSITHKDPGSRVILPYLKYRGIETLDAVFISHGDLDHFNGLPEVAAAGFIRRVYANRGFLQRTTTYGSPKVLARFLGQYQIPLGNITDFCTESPVQIESIWPRGNPAELSENDQSEVFLISYAGRTILLCGDIEEYAQQQIMDLYPKLRADVLVLPHHGSSENTSEAFIRRMGGGLHIASCAANRIRNQGGIDVLYTGQEGAVEVKIKADGTMHAVGYPSPE